MRVLSNVRPTPEQLSIVSRNRPGIEIIRGAAGSGKTTTALLRLRSLIGVYLRRNQRLETGRPVRILVLTFNKTLRGYIEALTKEQMDDSPEVDLTITTFAKWAKEHLNPKHICTDGERETKVGELGNALGLPFEFLNDEVDYILGRFLPEDLDNYLAVERTGRGASPRVDRPLRRRILSEVVRPYGAWLGNERWDWNDLAVGMSRERVAGEYDIIIADETQDFSANQLRAIRAHSPDQGSLTFVLDATQRIYARGFTWQEAGFTIRPENVRQLNVNYRNTVEIARFAASLVEGLPTDPDGTLPDFNSCTRNGPLPKVLVGRFSQQCDAAIKAIQKEVDLSKESVAFLHPKGWFGELKRKLGKSRLEYVTITRKSDWPSGDENIALSTLHSAKGLEFDHVFILGLNAQTTNHGEEEDDDRLMSLRRLLAMGIGRAKMTVTLGYKEDEKSKLIDYLDPATYELVSL